MNSILEIIKLCVPAFVDFIKYISSIDSKEFEKISEVWPQPLKTSMAKMRVSIKVRERFMKDDNGNSSKPS